MLHNNFSAISVVVILLFPVVRLHFSPGVLISKSCQFYTSMGYQAFYFRNCFFILLFYVCFNSDHHHHDGSGSFVDPAQICIATPSPPDFSVSHGIREILDSQVRLFNDYVNVRFARPTLTSSPMGWPRMS